MKKIIKIGTNFGERIDKFLAREFLSSRKTVLQNEYTRGDIIRLIKGKEISVNGKNIKPSYILKKGDTIRIVSIKQKQRQIIPNKNIKFTILYKDENLIVINKPAGIQVHPSRGGESDTLVNGLLYKFPEIKNVGDDPGTRPGVVHRLDKDTSGIMVVARNQKAFHELKTKFKDRKIDKKYQAIIYGILKDKKGIIEKPLARSSNYRKQVIAGRKTKTKIRPAVTEYKVLKEFKGYSLIKVTPKTGRTHQIRIHLTAIGHPIVGDKKYRLKETKGYPAAKRQLLHAESLVFELFGKRYSFSSKPPKDFGDFLGNLTKGV